MSSSIYSKFSTRSTPQTLPIPGENQVQNNAGGFVYGLDPFKYLEGFLILGSEGGSYYVKDTTLTAQNAENTIKAIALDGKRAVDLIVGVSHGGRAVKNDPAIFALALAAADKNPETRAYALSQLASVCRIPTHLFHFVSYVKNLRGFGRGLKRALASWYNDLPVEKLAYEVVKYQSRDGFSNRDVLRLAHPKTSDPARNAVYKWIVDGYDELITQTKQVPFIVEGFEAAKRATGPHELAKLIKDYNLSREMLPTEALTKPEVWEALLYAGKHGMPLTALICNLGNMSKVGLVKPLSAATTFIESKLRDREALKVARIHPLSILVALKTYGQGHGALGTGVWKVDSRIEAALNDAFYLAFEFLEPTGKNFLLGVDVSGSMSASTSGAPLLSCCEAATAMALAIAKTERNYFIHGFTTSFADLGITPSMTLAQAMKKTRNVNFGGTNCALPMTWAEKNQIDVDCFVVLTDNETWAGSPHPSQALRHYRERMNKPNAAEVVVGMTATPFTIADPKDPLTLDVVGFDTSVPQVINEFVR